MNYYSHHIGDYLRDTLHLTLLEHGVYRRLLDLYYASEKPLPLDAAWVSRLVRAESETERATVQFILDHFFQKTPEGWRNKRADAEIRIAARKAKVARINGKLGGRPKTQLVSRGLANQNPEETQGKAPNNQYPITNNQYPKRVVRSRGSRLPPGWKPSEILKAWAVKERADLDIETTIARFADHWSAVPGSRGLKLDWEATFRNWVRAERPGSKSAPPDYSAVIANIKD